MSNATETTFDAIQALRILIKLEETPDADTTYIRELVVADVKRRLQSAAAEAAADDPAEAPEESSDDALEEEAEAAPEKKTKA